MQHAEAAPDADGIDGLFGPTVLRSAAELRDAFQTAQPFKHVCIDGFLATTAAAAALRDFPTFRTDRAVNEFGHVGGKAVETRIAGISPFYRSFYDWIASAPFLDGMSAITGIPDLLPDPKLFGAGTHENRNGQSLDPHVDFNRNEDLTAHRRLNLLIYLNPEWDADWGGAIELHSDPRDPEADVVSAFLPLFNRAVIFETSEISWHGFETIRLPADKQHLSRKSISIYLYTKTRPAAEIAPPHATFYVQRPLPARMVGGYTLTEDDVGELREALRLRDFWIAHYQAQECQLNGRLEDLRRLNPFVVGPGRQQGPIAGLADDGWVAPQLTATIRPKRPLARLVVRGTIPEGIPPGGRLTVSVADTPVADAAMVPGRFSLQVPLPSGVRGAFTLRIDASRWLAAGDARGSDGAFVLTAIELIPSLRRALAAACKRLARHQG
jgi:Predicted proline hydroxylase